MGDDEWEKLPTEDKVVHKLWKARVAGYEEAKKKFQLIDSPKSREFVPYLGLLKKFVTDSNAVAQEKGLIATMAFVENAADAGRVCSDVVSGIVTKVLNGKTKIKQLGMDICLLYIEVEKQEPVMEELINGFANKQPKVVAACASLVCQALCEFGGKVITMKPIVKSLQKLLEHSDKNVREEAKGLAIELYRWIRDAIRPQLANIKPVQLKELEEEWSKVEPGKPSPTRFTKSEQAKMALAPPVEETSEDVSEASSETAENEEPDENIDPYDLMDPVDILPLIPKDFFERIVHTKWSERKEALESLDKLTSTPRIEAGHFGEIMGCLKKVISKDSNVVVVALAAKCVQGLARGLRKKFAPYAPMIQSSILEKFKEKKLNVVIGLRDAIDAVFSTTTLANMTEDIMAVLDSKNPNVKEETCKFLARNFCLLTPASLPKPTLKQLSPLLIKKMDDTVPGVRDAAADAVGTAMKVVGEKAMAQYFDSLDKLKQDKVRECYEKAEITAKSGAKTARPKTAPAAAPPPAAKEPPKKAPAKKKKASEKTQKPRPATAPQGGSKQGKTAAGKKAKKGKASYADDEQEPTEPELMESNVEDTALELLGENICKQLSSSNWKERIEGVEETTKKVEGMNPDVKQAQVIVRTLAKKPGWKDSNVMVLKGKFSLLGLVAKNSRPFSRRCAMYAISGLIEKVGDMKLKEAVKETLKIFAENISLNYVSLKVAKTATGMKNPKMQSESLTWMSEALKEFGFKIDLKPHVAFIKTCLQNTNPAVRASAIQFLATLYMYVGASLRTVFEDEKPALLQQIDAEFEKVKDEKPPAPIRKIAGDEEDDAEEVEDAEEDEGGDGISQSGSGVVNPEDLMDRTNIRDKITEGLMSKLADKNWKLRNEALQEIIDLFKQYKCIEPDVGELASGLKGRLGDSNKNLVTITLGICKTFAEAAGPGIVKYKGALLPAMINTLVDAKPQLKTAGKEALSAWHQKIGFVPFLTDEILATALKTQKKPNLRSALLEWLEETLPLEKKKLPVELNESIAPLLECLEDRSADVRKSSQSVVPMIMAHTGFEAMSKEASKLVPSSKATVLAILEKAREVCVPIQTAKKAKASKAAKAGTNSSAAESAMKDLKKASDGPKKSSEEPKKSKAGEAKKGASKKSVSASTSKKKKDEEDDGPSILHKIGKDQRIKDEKSLKVLKWNFTVPREEVVQQLKDQMAPCFSPSMMKNLFHTDFKYHLEAIATLSQAVIPQQEAMIESLDIVLKWFTLRFFDTNTSVLLKALEFLEALFDMLAEENYSMSEFEGSSFVPYLVLKIGDPKDNVRKSVHNLFKKLMDIYPSSKIFTYLMEGLVSKNSKARMECLTELGFLISKFGINVCQPTPAKALTEIAGQIGDRDNGVRSAALNAVVEAYNIVGEQVYKMVGRLNDKDRSYLEERIKRAGKVKSPPTADQSKQSNAANRKPQSKSAKKGTEAKGQAEQPVEKSKPRGGAIESEAQEDFQAPSVKREFEIDYSVIPGGKGAIVGTAPNVIEVDYNDEELAMPALPVRIGRNPTSSAAASNDIGAWIDLAIAQISNVDMQVSMEAIVQFDEVFARHGDNPEVIKKIDQYLLTCLVQFRMVFSRHMDTPDNMNEEVVRLFKLLLNGLLQAFSTQPLAIAVSKNVLKDVVLFLLNTLYDSSVSQLGDTDAIFKAINIVMLKIIKNSDHTSCFWAMIRLLMDGIEQETQQRIFDMHLRCLWKLSRMLPEIIKDVRVDALLLDIHIFLKKYPYSFWKRRADRKPLDTINVILKILIRLFNSEILEKTTLIEDKDGSELIPYLKKYIRGKEVHKATKTAPPEPSTAVSKNISLENKQPIEILQEIFKKIGSKEDSQVGLKELYDFKQSYPEEDVEPFISQTSQFFRNYIERGLKEIKEQEKRGAVQTTSNGSSTLASIGKPQISTTSSAGSTEPNKYLDRLQQLKEKYKISANAAATEEKPLQDATDNVPTPEPLVEISASNMNQPMPDVTKTTEVKKEVNLDDLKRRLQQIKMGSKN